MNLRGMLHWFPCKARNLRNAMTLQKPLPIVKFLELGTSRPEPRLAKLYRFDARPTHYIESYR